MVEVHFPLCSFRNAVRAVLQSATERICLHTQGVAGLDQENQKNKSSSNACQRFHQGVDRLKNNAFEIEGSIHQQETGGLIDENRIDKGNNVTESHATPHGCCARFGGKYSLLLL